MSSFVPPQRIPFCILFFKLRGKAPMANYSNSRSEQFLIQDRSPFRPRSPYKADRTYELPNKMYSTMKKVGLVDRKTKRKVKNYPLGPRAPYARAIRSSFHLLVFKEKNLISRNINAMKEGSFNRKMELTTLQPMRGN